MGAPRAASTATTAQGQPNSSGQVIDYALAAPIYRAAGWRSPLPTPFPLKTYPPIGFTGNGAIEPTDEDIARWCAIKRRRNLILRVMPGWVGIDVDDYDQKTGGRTLTEAEKRWGELPLTYRSSARPNDPISGIRVFRLPAVPDGYKTVGVIGFIDAAGVAIGDIELVQPHHRAICCWPSQHPKTGNIYRWYAPDGTLMLEGEVPPADACAELPQKWLDELENTTAHRTRRYGARGEPSDRSPNQRAKRLEGDGEEPLVDIEAALTSGQPTNKVHTKLSTVLYAVKQGGSRHDAILKPTMALLRYGLDGQSGVRWAINELRDAFVAAVGPDRTHGEAEAAAEFDRQLRGVGFRLEPDTPADDLPGHARFTDAGLAEIVADEVLRDRFLKVTGFGWFEWDGRRWAECADDGPPTEALRSFVVRRMSHFARLLLTDPDAEKALEAWKKVGSASRIAAVLKLGGNLVSAHPDALDANAELLNTPAGVVNLRTGEVREHDPALMLSKITRGSYRPGFTHTDVETLAKALPDGAAEWFWTFMGKGITGHHSDVNLLQQGTGNNGKGALVNAGIRTAVGDYGIIASPALFAAGRAQGHATSVTELRGARIALGEELNEGMSLDITAIKRMTDVERIKARRLYENEVEFATSHSLILNTNFRPTIAEVDWGTWRRLALLVFPYTFVDTPAEVTQPHHRLGDPGLKKRVEIGADGQHDALVTLMVDGARRYFADPVCVKKLPKPITDATAAWRRDTDRILAYWCECIEPDGDCAIEVATMFTDFNAWVESNGHRSWSQETFGERFGSHAATIEHGVEKRRTAAVKQLSNPPRRSGLGFRLPIGTPPVPTGQIRVWLGVRFIDGTISQKVP